MTNNVRNEHVAIVGAGRMGRGLAHVFAYAGYGVSLIDAKNRTDEAFTTLRLDAEADVRASLSDVAASGQFDANLVDPILTRITVNPAAQLAAHVGQARFVFEAVPEHADAKRPTLAAIDQVAAPETVIASTTSTMLADELASFVGRPERFLNVHWLNPAFLIPLVEISPAAPTKPTVIEETRKFLADIGKVPVTCAASPGYIVPRLQALIMNEAARMVAEGVATPEEIDQATRFGLGFRFAGIGVIEFIDWGGGDILYYADRYLENKLGSDRFAAPPVVKQNMESGAIGIKTGRGFYSYGDRDMNAYKREILARFLGFLDHFGLARAPALANKKQRDPRE